MKIRFNYQKMLAIALALALLAALAVFSMHEKMLSKQDAAVTLRSISDLKVQKIVDWRQTQLKYAGLFANDPYLKTAGPRWFKRRDTASWNEVQLRFKRIQGFTGAYSVALLKLDQPELGLTNDGKEFKLSAELRQAIQQAFNTRTPVISDLHRGDGSQPAHLDVIAPLNWGPDPTKAVVIYRLDANRYLYPLVASWPVPSRSAETLLVRREGQDALFLNEVRHRKDTALRMRIPLSASEIIAAQAIKGKVGVVEGLDYRGRRVLADIRPIAGSPWIMIAKVDLDEVMAQWVQSRRLLLLVAGLLAALGLVFYREAVGRERRVQMTAKFDQERTQRINDERYAAVTKCISEGIITVDLTGRIDLINFAACTLTGWSQNAAIGQRLDRVMVLADLETGSPLLMQSLPQPDSGAAARVWLLARDGVRHPVSLAYSHVFSEGRISGVIVTISDISVQYQRQREREFSLQLLSLITSQSDLHELIRGLTFLLKGWTGCEAVGLRLKDGEDYPYFETNGFSDEFVEAERHLCVYDLNGQLLREQDGSPVLECMCGNIICGRFNPDLSFFSPNGSFWTNSTTQLLAGTTEADRQARTRNRCNGEGYESVALIRLRHGGEALGLLQFNDRQPSRFTPELIVFLEGCADQIALALKQRQVNLNLIRSEARWRQLIETANEGVWSMDARGQTIFVNERMQAILGYSEAEMLGKPIASFIAPEDLPDHEAQMQSRHTLQAGRFERRLNHKDGHVVITQVSAMPLSDEQGRFTGSFAMFTDITDRRRAEMLLEQSRNLLAASQKLAKVGGWEWNLVSGEMFWTDETYAIHGLARGLISTDSQAHIERSLECYAPADRDLIKAAFERCVREGRAYDLELPFTRCDGRKIWVRTSAEAVQEQGVVTRVIGTLADISDRHLAEDDLRQSEKRFRLLVESSPDGIFVQSGGKVAYANRAARLILAGDPNYRLESREVVELFHPGYRRIVAERIQKLNAHKLTVPMLEEIVVWPDGTNVPVEVSAVPINYDGQDGAIVFMRDIAERKRTEQERERLISAIEQAAEMIVITDRTGLIQYVNPAFEKLTGYARDEVVGLNPKFLQSGLHDEAFYQDFWTTLLDGRAWEGQMANRRKDGSVYFEDATVAPVRDLNGEVVSYVAVKRDITEQLKDREEKDKLESQLRQSQKMESIGRLAGGVAHDFNNMLMVILGHAEMLLDDESLPEACLLGLNEISRAANRSVDLNRQLLAFARQQTVNPIKLDLNQAITNTAKMLKRLIGEDIEFSWHPGEDLGLVLIDPAQVDQILANLVVNARDAIGEHGRVIIETGRVSFDDDYCSEHAGTTPGEYVQLAVSDSGCGMDAATLDKIFEPFFTTKELGKGTGLGLATVYGIVKQNSGFINVYSELGRGTSFKIYFPRLTAGGSELIVPEAQGLVGGQETILIVEDNREVLSIGLAMLERLGYNAIPADSPLMALDLARLRPAKIDLLITDVVMPDMNGKELYASLTEFMPRLKCLYMSGYTAEVIAHHGILEQGLNFIQKPFVISTLDSRIREVLD